MTEKLVERFLRYVKIDTQSANNSETSPSTKKQFDLANLLTEELKAIGLSDVSVSEHCHVTATLESNLFGESKVPTTGFIAHMDTSPDVTGKDVNPMIHENYQGGDIQLKDIIIPVSTNPDLLKYKGSDIITSDGRTLLGADDKAGIAIIMTGVEQLRNNPELKHGRIRVAFTPDEEVGRGTEHFDVKKFDAKYAYTFDGEEVGEITTENFNAAGAVWTIIGKNAHPGYAKGKLVNSQIIATKLIGMLPREESPEMIDEKKEESKAYFHLARNTGEVALSTIEVAIRDFDSDGFEQRKNRMWNWQNELCRLHPDATIKLEIKDRYRNMKVILDQHPEVAEIAVEAMKNVGVIPVYKKARGGTDGANLSFKGLPTPDIFAGYLNMHSITEYVPVSSMLYATKILVKIPQIFAEKYHKG